MPPVCFSKNGMVFLAIDESYSIFYTGSVGSLSRQFAVKVKKGTFLRTEWKIVIKLFLIILVVVTASCTSNGKNRNIDEPDDSTYTDSLLEMPGQESLTITMYVNAQEGLRVRNMPDLNGERIGVLDFGAEVLVTKEEENTVNIAGVEGRWAFVKTDTIQGWVFGAYLAEKIPAEAQIDIEESFLTGEWAFIDNRDIFFGFNAGGDYFIVYGTVADGGTWKLNGNKLTLIEKEIGGVVNPEGYWSNYPDNPIVYDIMLSVIDDENIVFDFLNNAGNTTGIRYTRMNLQRKDSRSTYN